MPTPIVIVKHTQVVIKIRFSLLCLLFGVGRLLLSTHRAVNLYDNEAVLFIFRSSPER